MSSRLGMHPEKDEAHKMPSSHWLELSNLGSLGQSTPQGLNLVDTSIRSGLIKAI